MNEDQAYRAAQITLLAECFQRQTSKAMLQAYQVGLADMDTATLEHVVKQAIRTCKWMPVPATLLVMGGAASLEDQALLAWATVMRATKLGSYRSVDFEDKHINAAIRLLGGWPELLSRKGDQFDVWARKDFLATYAAAVRSEVSGELLEPLPGLSETEPAVVRQPDGTLVEYQPRPPAKVPSVLPPARPVPRLTQD